MVLLPVLLKLDNEFICTCLHRKIWKGTNPRSHGPRKFLQGIFFSLTKSGVQGWAEVYIVIYVFSPFWSSWPQTGSRRDHSLPLYR